MKNPILLCQHIGLTLSDVSILENINLSIYPGEFHLLIGDNGTGKTSIVNILSGVYPYGSYTGSVFYKNELMHLHTPQDALKQNIVTIHQDVCLFENMTIAENLFANLPKATALKGFTSLEKKIKLANAFFREHNFEVDSSRLVRQCSSAVKRKIELLKLYLMEPDFLILDEPVAIISNYDMDYFLELITCFKERGVTILCISHNYQPFLPLIDRFSYFHEKNLICTINQEDYQPQNLQQMILNDFCHSRYPKIPIEKGAEVLCVENLSNGDTLKDISFTLQKGEILGFFGRLGSGREILPKTLFGLEPFHSGTLYIDRLPAQITSPQDAINLGIAYVTDERIDCGLFPNLDLLENVYSIKENTCDHFWTRTKFEHRQYNSYSEKLNMNLSCDNHPVYLSGGEQQKLILMRWFMSPARIFIFNEPTQSIDTPSRIDIYNMFNDLILKGSSILIFSSNLEELMGVCDRVIFIKQGTISGEIFSDEAALYIQDYI